ncbi:MAG: SCO family protein [Metallibacterium scheffleri]|jgi:protein SCO1/2|uniref:SCO family protein n=1 Tax=Metallibacterium scheffleri TaxID=993689 RepID=UPI0026F05248|nr:SCO family protein [Metallibacterium scheffleri]MCK9366706.1 SCO family protein [Metallibacterium scheffleri]
MKKFAQLLCAALLGAGLIAATQAAESAPLPATSIYRIPPLTLVDQDGHRFSFASLAGTPRLLGMFYASCQMACPVEIETIKQIEHAVVKAGATPISVVLVSFDPTHDDVAVLRKTAVQHGVSAPEFLLTRAMTGDIGMLGGVLGISWRPLPGGGFQHNVVVALLDREGRIIATDPANGHVDPAFVEAIVREERATR